MRLLSTYIARQYWITATLIMVALVGIVWLTQAVRFLDYLLNRGLSVGMFIKFSSLMVPSFLIVVIPIALTLAAILIFNRLSNEHELTVMQAVGSSPLQLLSPVIALSGLMLIFCYALSVYVIPISYTAFKEMQQQIRQEYAVNLLQEGKFISLGNNRTLYIGKRDASGGLRDVLFHDGSKPRHEVTITAAYGLIQSQGTTLRLLINDGMRQELDPIKGRIAYLSFKDYILDLSSLLPIQDKKRSREIQEYFTGELLNPPADISAKDRQRLIAHGHSRLTMPLYCLSLPILAVLMLWRLGYDRRGHASGLAVIAAGFVCIMMAALGLENLAAQQPVWLLLQDLNALLPLIAAVWLLARQHGMFRLAEAS